ASPEPRRALDRSSSGSTRVSDVPWRVPFGYSIFSAPPSRRYGHDARGMARPAAVARFKETKAMLRRFAAIVVLVLLVAGAPMGAIAQWDSQPSASRVTPDPWPKIVKQGDVTYTLYQPQVDGWDQYTIKAHAAVSVQPASAK